MNLKATTWSFWSENGDGRNILHNKNETAMDACLFYYICTNYSTMTS